MIRINMAILARTEIAIRGPFIQAGAAVRRQLGCQVAVACPPSATLCLGSFLACRPPEGAQHRVELGFSSIRCTEDVARAGEILKTEGLDHVMVGNGKYCLLRALGHFPADLAAVCPHVCIRSAGALVARRDARSGAEGACAGIGAEPRPSWGPAAESPGDENFQLLPWFLNLRIACFEISDFMDAVRRVGNHAKSRLRLTHICQDLKSG